MEVFPSRKSPKAREACPKALEAAHVPGATTFGQWFRNQRWGFTFEGKHSVHLNMRYERKTSLLIL